MSRKDADVRRDFWSKRSYRLMAGGFAAVAAVVLVFGLGATRARSGIPCIEPPVNTAAPQLSSGLGAPTPGVGVGPQTLTLTEGSWDGDCPIRDVQYYWYEDGTTTLENGVFDSSGTTTYPTDDVGHAISAVAVACDTANHCAPAPAVGSFAPTDGHTHTDSQVGVNGACGSSLASPDDKQARSTATAYDQVAASKYVRIPVYWNDYETTPPTGSTHHYSTTYPDPACIQALHAAGESVLVVFVGTPCWETTAWVTTAPAHCNTTTYDAQNLDATLPDAQAYSLAAKNLVTSLANDGRTDTCTGLCGIQAVEVWNEEDNGHVTWNSDEAHYETLLKVAYQTLHDPALGVTAPLVVSGGTVHLNHVWDNNLLAQEYHDWQNPTGCGSACVYCPLGPHGKFCFDRLGVHTYPADTAHYSDPTLLNDYSLGVPSTTLTSPGITTTTGTTVQVASWSGFPTSGRFTIRIDGEDMTVTAGQGTTTWTVTRGANCTTAATHTTLTAPVRQITYVDGVNSIGTLCGDLNAWGDGDTNIWITEMGTQNTDHVQNASTLTDFYAYIGGSSVRGKLCGPACSRIEFAMWFTDYSTSSGGAGFSMLDSTLNPRPEYAAFVNLP